MQEIHGHLMVTKSIPRVEDKNKPHLSVSSGNRELVARVSEDSAQTSSIQTLPVESCLVLHDSLACHKNRKNLSVKVRGYLLVPELKVTFCLMSN